MKAFPSARMIGIVLLVVGVAGSSLAAPASQTAPDKVATMVDQVFAQVPTGDQRSVVFKDDLERTYLAFYISTYADIREVRAYSITFRNVSEFDDEQQVIDSAIAAGNYAEAFDALLSVMRLDLGSQYVSDVGVDGIQDAEVAVGEGHMRDRFHNQVFADYASANEAYLHWLERAIALSQG
ncbi:MAG: hypothetical protein PVJ49_03705 [Acidobacteriota bacterium]|jgi:hypothetical protein